MIGNVKWNWPSTICGKQKLYSQFFDISRSFRLCGIQNGSHLMRGLILECEQFQKLIARFLWEPKKVNVLSGISRLLLFLDWNKTYFHNIYVISDRNIYQFCTGMFCKAVCGQIWVKMFKIFAVFTTIWNNIPS